MVSGSGIRPGPVPSPAARSPVSGSTIVCPSSRSRPTFCCVWRCAHMWAHRQTQQNVGRLRELGHTIVEPETGDLAAGEGTGPGRMPEPETIFAHIGRLIEPNAGLAGRRVLVTAGPTREPIDPVRFISNHSSGKMGFAVAAAAWRRGATVDLVASAVAEAA